MSLERRYDTNFVRNMVSISCLSNIHPTKDLVCTVMHLDHSKTTRSAVLTPQAAMIYPKIMHIPIGKEMETLHR